MAAKKQFEKIGYKITGNPDEADHPYHFDKEMTELLEKTFRKVQRQEVDIEDRLNILINRYPAIPHFKNYLSTYYALIGDNAMAEEVNNKILEGHPDYLYARLNKALSLMDRGEAEKVPDILGEFMDIKMLYPDRNAFHELEVLSFLKIAVLYFIAIDDNEAAKMRLDMMMEIDDEHNDTYIARQHMVKYTGLKLAESFKKLHKLTWDMVLEKMPVPTFQNPELAQLYEFG